MTRARVAAVGALIAGLAVIPDQASAIEPWVAPETARPCPHLGPGWLAVAGSRTCVRIGGRVVTEYGISAKRPGPGSRDAQDGFSTRAKIRAEARTETDLGDVTLVYQTDVRGGRALAR